MNQSTNYNFNLPEGTDIVNLLTQLIPNWSSLDSILKGIDDATFANATETVALNVHAITRSNPDSKLLRWIATANFEAGDTFTIDGITIPAALPSGEALGEDAYIAGAVVIAALNSDESALTVYVTSGAVAVAADSEKLGGELPAYYSTKSYADGIKTTADNAASAIALKALVNTFYDIAEQKMYIVNVDGTKGSEIKMGGVSPDLTKKILTLSAANQTYTATTKDGVLYGSCYTNNISNAIQASFDNGVTWVDIIGGTAGGSAYTGYIGVAPAFIPAGTILKTAGGICASGLGVYEPL